MPCTLRRDVFAWVFIKMLELSFSKIAPWWYIHMESNESHASFISLGIWNLSIGNTSRSLWKIQKDALLCRAPCSFLCLDCYRISSHRTATASGQKFLHLLPWNGEEWRSSGMMILHSHWYIMGYATHKQTDNLEGSIGVIILDREMGSSFAL